MDAEHAATVLFAIYTYCLREWISTELLDLGSARKRLKSLLALALTAIERKLR